MGNQNNDIYGRPDDPARIKHERYNAGISCGKKYLEASVEQGKNGNIEPSLNAGLKSSSSKTKPFYSEQGTNEEISLSKEGFKKSKNYYKSDGLSRDLKKGFNAYVDRKIYVNKDDVDRYNTRVKDFEEIKKHPTYKMNRCIRQDIMHDYSDCIHPHDYNKEFNIP